MLKVGRRPNGDLPAVKFSRNGLETTVMRFVDLADDIVDIIISHVVHLVQLMGARSACRQLHARVNQRFLPVIAPPCLKHESILSMKVHGQVLMKLFGEYRKWLTVWFTWYNKLFDEAESAKKRQTIRRHMREGYRNELDGFFSLAPWSRIPNETVPTLWQAEHWLHQAVYEVPAADEYEAASGTPWSRFYHRRQRDAAECSRAFFSTPAAILNETAMTAKRIVLQPINFRNVHDVSIVNLPDLDGAMIAALRVVGRVVSAYLPNIPVVVEPVCEHSPIHRVRTRSDTQGARRPDGHFVTQLSTHALLGARTQFDERDGDRGDGPTFTTFVVAPHLFSPESNLDWVFSSRLAYDQKEPTYDEFVCDALDAWVLSTHQVQAYLGAEERVRVLCSLLLYCVFTEGLGLSVCESVDCAMNNCDGIEEARSTSLLLCPTCMRKLHLSGIVGDAQKCRARVEAVLSEEHLL